MQHQGLVQPGVGLGQMQLAAADAPLKQGEKVLLLQVFQGVRGNVGKVVDLVPHLLQPADQLQGAVHGLEHPHPVIQHGLHLKGPALLPGLGQHDLVGLLPGHKPQIQLLPLFAFKYDGLNGRFGLGVAQKVQQVLFGGKLHHHAAQVKDNILIHGAPSFMRLNSIGLLYNIRTELTKGRI